MICFAFSDLLFTGNNNSFAEQKSIQSQQALFQEQYSVGFMSHLNSQTSLRKLPNSSESQISDSSNLQPLTQNCPKWQFPDKITYQLYSIFANSRADPSEIEQAEKVTLLKSYYHQGMLEHLAQIKEKSCFKRGYQLRANNAETQFLKNRSYSIVSSSLQRKRTMTESDFKKIYENNPKLREIVYKQSKFRGDKDLPTTGKKLIEQLDKEHQSSNEDRQIKIAFASPYLTMGTQTNEVKVEPVKAKPYKFRRISRREPSGLQTKQLTCNIFNMIDPLFESDPSGRKVNRSFEPIAKPIKLKPWKAK